MSLSLHFIFLPHFIIQTESICYVTVQELTDSISRLHSASWGGGGEGGRRCFHTRNFEKFTEHMHFRQYFTRILDLKGQFPDLSLPCPSEKFTCHVLILSLIMRHAQTLCRPLHSTCILSDLFEIRSFLGMPFTPSEFLFVFI